MGKAQEITAFFLQTGNRDVERLFVPGMALFVFTQANSSYSLGPRSKYPRKKLIGFPLVVYSFLGQSMNGCCVNGFIARTTYMEPRVGGIS